MAGEDWCAWHHPKNADKQRAWRAQGGAARSNARRLKRQYGTPLDLAEVDALLGLTLRGVLAGKLEPGVANASASVARAIASVRQVGELEQRVRALEERADGRKGRNKA